MQAFILRMKAVISSYAVGGCCFTSPAPPCMPARAGGAACRAGSRPGQNERLARFVANTADHGFESVRSLRSEVFAQSKAVEQRQRVDIQNLARGPSGVDGE